MNLHSLTHSPTACRQAHTVTVANNSALDLDFSWVAAPRPPPPPTPRATPCASASCNQIRQHFGVPDPSCYLSGCRAAAAREAETDPTEPSFAESAGDTLEVALSCDGASFSVTPTTGVLAAHSTLQFEFAFEADAPRIAALVADLLVGGGGGVSPGQVSRFAL